MDSITRSVTYSALVSIAFFCMVSPLAAQSHKVADSDYLKSEGASAKVGFGFDDNVFRTPDPDPDYYYQSEAEVGVGSDKGLVPWSLSGKLEDKRFFEFHRESTFDSFLNSKVSHDFSKEWNLSVTAAYEHDHIDREDPSTHRAETQARITRLKGNTTLSFSPEKWSHVLRYGVQDLNFRGVSFEGSDINTDDEDRIEQEVQFDTKYELSKTFSPKFQTKLANGSYDSEVDDSGFGRDSKSVFAALGGEIALSDALQGELLVGSLTTDFDEDEFDDFTAAAGEGTLQWHENDSAHTLTFVVQREFKVTNVADASGYFQNAYQLTHEYKVIDPLTTALQFTYVDIDFRGFDLYLHDIEVMPYVEYQILESLVSRFEYSWKERSSNLDDAQFEAHRIFGSLTYSFL